MNSVVVKANMVVFIASFCTLVIELVAGRIMAPYVGVSLYTWTSIIGVVLAGISIGAWVGGTLADRYPRPATLGWLLFLSGVGALTIAPLTDLIGAAQLQTTLMLRILLLTTAIFFIPSTLLGMISPVVVKLTLDNLDRTGNVVGKIYAFSTLGSIIGTFATGFFLISWMGTRNILLTMGAILIGSAFLFGGLFLKRKAAVISASCHCRRRRSRLHDIRLCLQAPARREDLLLQGKRLFHHQAQEVPHQGRDRRGGGPHPGQPDPLHQ